MIKRTLSLILAALLVLAAFLSAAAAEEVAEENNYYVYTENGNQLNVRNVPGGDIIGKLNYGTQVKVISFINDYWAMIKFQYDKPGSGIGEWEAYVSRRFLIDINPSELKKIMEEEETSYTGDMETDINAEFRSAVDVEDYKITVRPARVTSWVNMRWIPSETGMIIAQYKATEELIVLKEMDRFLQVQDPDTGDVGYIQKKFAIK